MTEINCFSRLNLGLIDLSNSPFRIDGAIGFSINLPSGKISLDNSNELSLNIKCDDSKRIYSVIDRFNQVINNSFKFSLNVESYVDSHIGLGTGTQLSMSVAKALDIEYNLNLTIDELAYLAGSGGTSNIGIYSFLNGGFNVDSGRLYKKEKSLFGPGENFLYKKVSPLLMSLSMPEWYICIIVPHSQLKISGNLETDLFQLYTPIPTKEVDSLCKWILTGILPSIKTSDFSSFCYCVERCMEIGFRAKEIDTYSEVVKNAMTDLKEKGGQGVGMSSFGPTVFGFFESYSMAENAFNLILKSNKYYKAYLTTPRNSGASIIHKTELYN